MPTNNTPNPTEISDGERNDGLTPNIHRYITANPLSYGIIKEYREQLKHNPTDAERIMWEYLRGKRIGHKIRRQHVINEYIVDFVCLDKKVVIEIDGKIHDLQTDKDAARTYKLKSKGYDVIRFTNDEVFADPQSIANKIRNLLDSKDTTVGLP